MGLGRCWVMTLLMVCAGVSAGKAEIVFSDPRGTFRFTVPSGMVPVPEEAKDPGIAWAWHFPVEDDGATPITLGIQRLGGTLPREHSEEKALRAIRSAPHIKHAVFSRGSWRGFKIHILETTITTPLGDMITMTAQIPLKREAIQVIVVSPPGKKAEAMKCLNETLASLEGDSSWARPAGAEKSGEGPTEGSTEGSGHYGAFLLVIAGAIVIGGLIILWWLSKVSPKGVVLVAAVCIWVAGNAITGLGDRELLAIGGALKLLGFAGGLLGVVDLLWKRKAASG